MENCPICGDEPQCSLVGELISQSQKGGHVDKNMRYDGKVGPFITKGNWYGYAQRVKAFADTGCLHASEVKELADKITREKEERGELV